MKATGMTESRVSLRHISADGDGGAARAQTKHIAVAPGPVAMRQKVHQSRSSRQRVFGKPQHLPIPLDDAGHFVANPGVVIQRVKAVAASV